MSAFENNFFLLAFPVWGIQIDTEITRKLRKGWSPATGCNVLPAQQRVLWARKSPWRTCECGRICSGGGFSSSAVLWAAAASLAVLSALLPGLWEHSRSCLLKGAAGGCFHVLGVVSLKSPGGIDHRHFISEGFQEQVGQMCHRWPFWDGVY